MPTAAPPPSAVRLIGAMNSAKPPNRYLTRLYESVATGEETRIVLEANSKPDYQVKLDAELKEMRESDLWTAGAMVRSLRPENQKKAWVIPMTSSGQPCT